MRTGSSSAGSNTGRRQSPRDILFARPGGRWERERSTYTKCRIAPAFLRECLAGAGFSIGYFSAENGQIAAIAQKGP
jgi:hypothetical protein